MAKAKASKMPGGAMMLQSAPSSAPKRRYVTSVNIKKAKGGHVVSHGYGGGYYGGDDKDTVFGKGQHKQLLNHIASKIGVPKPHADVTDGDADDE